MQEVKSKGFAEMATSVVVTFNIDSAEQCHETLNEFFRAVGYVRHPEAAEITCHPGSGPFQQMLTVHMRGDLSEMRATGVADDIVARILGRTSGVLSVSNHQFQGDTEVVG